MTYMTYDVGDVARLKVQFLNADKQPEDPTTVSLVIQAPDNTQSTITSGSIVQEATGLFHYDLSITQAGVVGANKYIYRWVGTGNVQAVEESSITVTPTILVPQPVTTAEWTADDLTAVNLAIKSNALKVQFADRSVTYRSLAELLLVRNLILTQIGLSNGQPIRRQLRMWSQKGFGG